MTRKQHRRHHGFGHLRGIDHVPCSVHHDKGRFGRLFPTLPALHLDHETLERIANTMVEDDPREGDSKTPAGFTFLGQFIDHDITLDTTSSLDRQSDPAAVRNMRTPNLELDSLYGRGPEADPALYDRKRPGALLTGTADNPDDLPRNSQGTALIGDPRNDENGLISQFHLALLRFHNGVLRLVEQDKLDEPRHHEEPFREAQRLVRWHYQWIVVHEFLPAIVDADVLRSVLRDGLQLYPGHAPFIPVEFAVAAYRFGHSQVRNRYRIQRERVVELFQPGTEGLTSFAPVPRENVVDWRFFFDLPGGRPQPARKIDTKVARELFQLPFVAPGEVASLPLRNLLRAQSFSLPAGEVVAQHMGIEPLSPEELGTGLKRNPLWFYILKEAELNREDRLGPVGGRIVAETLIGLLRCDPHSYLSMAPRWQPSLPTGRGKKFETADLLQIAEEYGR